MSECVVPGCQNRNSTDVQYYLFPLNEERRKAWVKAVKRKCEENWQPTMWSKICSLHFTPDDYLIPSTNNCKVLRSTAVPSRFRNTVKLDTRCRRPVNTAKNQEVTTTLENNPTPKYKCYIIISVDCARDIPETESDLSESSDSSQKQSPKKQRLESLTEECLIKKAERLQKTIDRQEEEVQELEKIIHQLREKGAYE